MKKAVVAEAKTLAPQHFDNAETSEKARKENKDRAPAIDDGDRATHLRNWITRGVNLKSVRDWRQ